MHRKLTEMTTEELWQLFPIALTEHKQSWAAQYREMEERLRAGLSAYRIVRISHVGSTAVDGIWAKDIVDILVELAAEENMEAAAGELEKLGFIRMSSSEGRRSFNRGYTEEGFAEKVYHLHLRYEGDNDEVYFRDYLRAHLLIAKEYEALKLRLWKQYEHDRDGYTAAKSAFIRRYTQEAKNEYNKKMDKEET